MHDQFQNNNSPMRLQTASSCTHTEIHSLVKLKLRVETTRLFLEEVFKLLARIQRPRNALRRRRRARGRSGRRSVLLYGCAKFVKRALIALIFSRHLFQDRLHAFEASGGVEISALFAAMKFECAARAFAFWVKARLQHGAAVRTTGASNRANHARRSRSNLFLSWVAFVRTFIFFLGIVSTLVAPMFILPVQGNLRGMLNHFLNQNMQVQN